RAPGGLEGVDAARSRGLRVQSKPSACGRAPACAVAEAAAGPGSIVGQVAAPPSLGFPQAVTSKMQANRRAPIVLRLVLDLGLQDRLLAGGADLISSAAGPQLHGAATRQRAGVELVPDEISQRLR